MASDRSERPDNGEWPDNGSRPDNGSGGLFSDGYEAPKRENPYLRKNREKAAAKAAKSAREEERRARKAERDEAERAERMERAVRNEALRGDLGQAEVGRDTVGQAEDGRAEAPGYRRRTFSDFWFEHVRLIAAILTVCVILSLVLITDVVSVVENLITQSQQADKEPMTLRYVEGLSELSEPITWGHLSRFRRSTNATKKSLTWVLAVEDTSYEIRITGTDVSHAPNFVRLYDMRTGDSMDLDRDDLDAFLAEHP